MSLGGGKAPFAGREVVTEPEVSLRGQGAQQDVTAEGGDAEVVGAKSHHSGGYIYRGVAIIANKDVVYWMGWCI